MQYVLKQQITFHQHPEKRITKAPQGKPDHQWCCLDGTHTCDQIEGYEVVNLPVEDGLKEILIGRTLRQ